MRFGTVAAALTALLMLAVMPAVVRADDYKLDDVHSSFYFKIGHLGMSEVYGRFNKVSGNFSVDGASSKFDVTIDPASIDTNNQKRDDHLKSPDFFSVKQFPVMGFKSTSVSVSGETYSISGELTIHGVTKPVTVEFKKLGEGKDPWGMTRIGFTGTHTISRSAFGMSNMIPAVADEVTLLISFEGIMQ